MGRWVDRLSEGQRAELTDAGRLGNSRFALDGQYARHIANRELALVVVETFDGGVFLGKQRTRALLKYPGRPIWYSADLILEDGVLIAPAVNMYHDESTARRNAEDPS